MLNELCNLGETKSCENTPRHAELHQKTVLSLLVQLGNRHWRTEENLAASSKPFHLQTTVCLAASCSSPTSRVTHRCNSPLARNHYHSSSLLTAAVPTIWITSFINQHDPVTCQERNNIGCKSGSGGKRQILSKKSNEWNLTSIEDLSFIDSSYHCGLSILSICLHQATKIVQGAVDLPAHPEMVDVVFCFAFLHSHVKPAAGRGQDRQPIGLQRTRLRAADTRDLEASHSPY